MSTRAPSRATPGTRTDAVSIALALAGFAVAVLLAVPALRVPAHVARLTVDNPLPWPVHVQASEPGAPGWLGVGTVDRGQEQAFHSLLDQGDRWVIRFAYAGHHAELRVTRAELERAGWRVTVPGDLADQLGDADVPEAPGG